MRTRGRLAVLCLTAAIAGAGATGAQAAFPGTNGRIAFGSNRDGDGEIFSANSTGAEPLQLTSNSVDDASPVWSPDGSRIAYVSRSSGFGGSYDIYVMNANGTGQTRLTTSPSAEFEPTWSADGSEIAFISNRYGNYDVFKLNVAAQTLDPGTVETRLTTDTEDDIDPAWSPSGTTIAFASSRPSGAYHLFTMKADGTSQARVTTYTGGESHPAWSPGGLSLAYQRTVTNSQAADVYTLTLADPDNTQTAMTTDAADDSAPNWSPDGSRIVFQTDRHAAPPPAAPNTEIYSLTVASPATSQTRLTTDPSRDSAPDWGTHAEAAAGTTGSVTFHVVNGRGTPQWSEVRLPTQADFEGSNTDGFGSITTTLAAGDIVRFNRGPFSPPSHEPPESPYFEYTVPNPPVANVTITLPNTTGPSYLPGLSDAERWLVGNVNADRVAHGVPALHVSETLNRTADAEARDAYNQRLATGNYAFPSAFYTVTRIDWGWPTGNSDLTVVDAPYADPNQVRKHWDGTEGTPESAGLAHALRAPGYNAIGIGDGNGVWILHLDACPTSDPAASRCELTADTGDPSIVLPPYVPPGGGGSGGGGTGGGGTGGGGTGTSGVGGVGTAKGSARGADQPSCTLTAGGTRVAARGAAQSAKRKKKQAKGVLQLTARCSQAANVTVTGLLTEVIKKKRKKRGKSKRSRPKTLRVAAVGGSADAGKLVTLTVRLPRAALSALKQGARESLAFTLTATNANGTDTATAKIRRLTLVKAKKKKH
jgi:Tol biopolymer transport system component